MDGVEAPAVATGRGVGLGSPFGGLPWDRHGGGCDTGQLGGRKSLLRREVPGGTTDWEAGSLQGWKSRQSSQPGPGSGCLGCWGHRQVWGRDTAEGRAGAGGLRGGELWSTTGAPLQIHPLPATPVPFQVPGCRGSRVQTAGSTEVAHRAASGQPALLHPSVRPSVRPSIHAARSVSQTTARGPMRTLGGRLLGPFGADHC